MLKKEYYCFLGLFLCLLFAQSAVGQTADELFDKGVVAETKEDYPTAILFYSKALALDKNFENAHFNRAWCYFYQGLYNEAVRDFSFVIEKDSTVQGVFAGRGLTRFNLGYYQEAINDYGNEIRNNRYDHLTWNNLGAVYEKLNQLPKALESYNKAIEYEPNYEKAAKSRDRVRNLMAKQEQQPEKNTVSAKEFFELGKEAAERGIFEKAIEHFSKAIDIDPNHREAYNKRAYAKMRLSRYKESLDDLNKCLSLGADKFVYNKMGWAKMKLEMHEEALLDFEKSLSIDAEYSDAKTNKELVMNILQEKKKKTTENKPNDTKPPTITIVSPMRERGVGVVRLDQAITIIGKASDESGIAKVIINGNEAKLNASGDFDAEVKLTTGKNQIYIVAKDYAGNQREEKLIVERKENTTTATPNITNSPNTTNATGEITSTPTKLAYGGKNYALMFATDDYDEWGDLLNPINDATQIGKELKDSYQFDLEVVNNATKEQVILKLREYAKKTYETNDQLFIFFAGHGYFDEVFGEGFLVMKNSKKIGDDGLDSYLSHSTLRTYVNNIKSKHIFLTLDVCFGGTFDPVIASRGQLGTEYDNVSKIEFINRKLRFKTRRYLTSGGKEYVSDGRAGQHSPFARKFLEALRNFGGSDGILTIAEIQTYIDGLSPEPRCGEFGDNEPGSDFIFVAK